MPTLLIILVIETWSKQKYFFSFFSKFLTKGRFSLSHFCENLVSIITILSVKDKDLFLSRVIWRSLICHKRFSFIQSSRLLVSFSIPTSENILRLPISAPFLLSLILSVKHISRDWISSLKIFNRLKSLNKLIFVALETFKTIPLQTSCWICLKPEQSNYKTMEAVHSLITQNHTIFENINNIVSWPKCLNWTFFIA